MTVALLIVVAVCLIALEAFFSGVEAAAISCDKVETQQLAKSKSRAARQLRDILAAPDRLVATTLLGTNLCVVGNSVLVTVLVSRHLGLAAPFAVTAVLGPLVFFFGELLPKIFFQQRANDLALKFARLLKLAQTIFSPLVWVLSIIQRCVLGRQVSESGLLDAALISRDQLASPAQDALQSLRRLGSRAIARVIQFSDKRVGDVMVDISQVISVSPDTGATRAMKTALQKGLSRLLVHSGQINNPVGFVHISSLHRARRDATVRECMSQLVYVAETQTCPGVLKEMQNLHVPMAAVVNEFGACVGTITLEDLIEEIFGEIRDELDRSPKIDRHADEGYIDVDAFIGITEMKSMLDISLPSGRYETLAGFLIERFGAIPAPGTDIIEGKRQFIVIDSDERRIRRVRILQSKATDSKKAGSEQADEKRTR